MKQLLRAKWRSLKKCLQYYDDHEMLMDQTGVWRTKKQSNTQNKYQSLHNIAKYFTLTGHYILQAESWL